MKVLDPVCRMEVTTDSKYKTSYDGKHYYFCSQGCKEDFSKDPVKYLDALQKTSC